MPHTSHDLLFFTTSGAPPVGRDFTVRPMSRAPVLYGPRFVLHDDDGNPIIPPPIGCELVARDDPETFKSEITVFSDAQWQETLSEAGSAQLVVDNDSTDLDTLDRNNDMIRFRLYGEAAFMLLPRQIEQLQLDKREGAVELTTLSGPGHLALLDEAVVYPSRGTDQTPIEEDRIFNWASPYLDDSSWGPTNAFVQQGTGTYYTGDIPNGFPGGLGAFWMGGVDATQEWAPPGWTYHRVNFTVPADVHRAIIYLGSDAQSEVWIDGQIVLASTFQSADPTQLFTVIIDITPGDHLCAVANLNDLDPEGDQLHNPGGFVLGMLPVDNVGTVAPVTEPLLISSNLFPGTWDWVMVDNTIPFGLSPVKTPPGVTPGLVIAAILAEAQARGELLGVNMIGNEDVDAWGRPWPVVGEISTKVGTDYLTFLREMSGTYIDMWMSPWNLNLYVFGIDMRGGRNTTAHYHPPTDPDDPNTGNVTQLKRTRKPVQANALLIRYPGGWHEVTDIAPGDSRRCLLLSLSARSLAEAVQIGRKQLEFYGAERDQIELEVDPIRTVDYPFQSVDTPYFNMMVGDIIRVPDVTLTGFDEERLVQVTVTQDPDNGDPLFVPVVKDVFRTQEERWEQATKKMTDGTMSGDSKVATPIARITNNEPDCCAPQPSEGGGGGGG